MATPSIESTKITLNGIIKELGLGSFFEVSIDKDQSIFKLKEEIYEKVQASLPNNIVGGISIKLWSVRVPRNDSKIDQLKEDVNATVENVLGGVEVGSFHFVRDCFDNLNSSEIHIVIQDLPIWSVPHRLDEEILLCDLLTNHEATNARNSSANSIKESKEREKLDYYDETVLVKKPTHYRTDYQIDVEEDDNCFSNSGETADPDD
ncbi:hypothetical protein RhiirA4_550090 [Rhizophagus irregularis]|nr:hypothetical protein RhiirA4_550090 [Rhizophagus irregularis]